MPAILEKKENNTVDFTITVSKETFGAAVDEAFKKNVKKISVPGFRKGKAPRKLIEKTYGEGIFFDEAVDSVLPAAYDDAVKELNLEPVDTPKIDIKEIGKDKDLVVSASVTVKPEVKLGEYKGLKLDDIVHTVSDDDVDAELSKRQEKGARQVTVEDRAVQEKDTATIDFEGFIDGTAFAGGKGENFELVIGSGQFIPGFEEQIIGKSIGDEFDVNVTFPEDYHSEELKGKAAVFKTKVNAISYKELPELDDEFAKDVSEFDTLAELKEDIKKKLQESADARTKQEKENAAVDKVVENMTVDVPECMVNTRIESTIRENNARMAQQGISFEQYLGYMGTTLDQFKEQIKPNAELQVKGTLALEQIAKEENIEVSEADLEEQLKKMAEAYSMELEKVKEFMREEDLENIKADLKISKALDFIVENTKWSKPAAKKPAAKKAAADKADAKTAEEKPKKTTRKKKAEETKSEE
ncbi:trigger factor [Congzhengia minquanensis]|uniref:Trigger factor n=1 Tax=Congzhengia minquanensis TaxID=2763657 RepID=A0A926HUK7_9FIRM|nr:trigger factor [Congzhengia minquanensis]MBC8540677.1 trigger factor [Congzhengia minquanensis]